MRVISDANNLMVIYEDNHLIVVNKRCGDIVQGDKTGDVCLKDIVSIYLKKKYNKPGAAFVGVIHRLDRPTSGVVLFAKTSKALARMNKLIQNKDNFKKTYFALVEKKGLPDDEIIGAEKHMIHHLSRDSKKNKSFASNTKSKDSKCAEMKYKIIRYFKNYALLEINLITGRHHQIRAQLSAVGLHIKGDLKYGARRSNADGGICLHAGMVNFLHPIKNIEINIKADFPDNFLLEHNLKN